MFSLLFTLFLLVLNVDEGWGVRFIWDGGEGVGKVGVCGNYVVSLDEVA